MTIPIKILDTKISKADLDEFLGAPYASMIKFVVDIKQRLICLGGEMHADAEKVLLDNGSLQENLWGANLYPSRPGDAAIEFFSLINIRPADSNFSMEVTDPDKQGLIRDIAHQWIAL